MPEAGKRGSALDIQNTTRLTRNVTGNSLPFEEEAEQWQHIGWLTVSESLPAKLITHRKAFSGAELANELPLTSNVENIARGEFR